MPVLGVFSRYGGNFSLYSIKFMNMAIARATEALLSLMRSFLVTCLLASDASRGLISLELCFGFKRVILQPRKGKRSL
jgi:hypothetical protein